LISKFAPPPQILEGVTFVLWSPASFQICATEAVTADRIPTLTGLLVKIGGFKVVLFNPIPFLIHLTERSAAQGHSPVTGFPVEGLSLYMSAPMI